MSNVELSQKARMLHVVLKNGSEYCGFEWEYPSPDYLLLKMKNNANGTQHRLISKDHIAEVNVLERLGTETRWKQVRYRTSEGEEKELRVHSILDCEDGRKALCACCHYLRPGHFDGKQIFVQPEAILSVTEEETPVVSPTVVWDSEYPFPPVTTTYGTGAFSNDVLA